MNNDYGWEGIIGAIIIISLLILLVGILIGYSFK